MLKAWAQLVRLPNVFTAPADVIAGAALSLYVPHQDIGLPGNIVLLCLISVCYYMAGMILNDVADVDEDGRERPFRPIPSGRVSRQTASVVGVALLVAGLVIGLTQLPAGANWRQSAPLFALPVLILLYNFWLKHTWLGPITMGLCRGFNLLLGAIMVAEPTVICYIAAGVSTLYITGVTIIAFDETRRLSIFRMRVGQIVIYFSMIILAGTYHSYSRLKGMPEHVDYANYFVIALLLMPAFIWIRAVDKPEPAIIGKAIKYSILGLIVIDAVQVMYPLGWPGLLVLLFLIPALFLGKYIYST